MCNNSLQHIYDVLQHIKNVTAIKNRESEEEETIFLIMGFLGLLNINIIYDIMI